ncbi:MAG: nucleotidyltransferase domain-containing protein [Methanophagales archaeon]|nr:nucleotidyltransferase domain-containing protein [Methanophagales archaeon]
MKVYHNMKKKHYPDASALDMGAGIGYEDYRETICLFKDLIIEKLRDSIVSLVLYGSVARGEAKKESDIDLLIVQKDAPDVYYKRLRPFIEVEKELRKSKVYEINRKKGLMPYLSYVILSQKEAEKNLYLFLDMIEDSIILLDKKDFLKRRLEELRHRLNMLGSKKVFLKDGSWYWDLKPDLVAGEVFEL